MDPDWRPDTDGPVLGLAYAEGRLFVGGRFGRIGDFLRRGLGAVADDGTVLPWDPGPESIFGDQWVKALVVVNNRVWVGGWFSVIGGRFRDNVAELDMESGAATSWIPGGADVEVWRVAEAHINAVLVVGNAVFVGGNFTDLVQVPGRNPPPRRGLAAFQATSGQLLPWNPDANNEVVAMAMGCGNIIVGGGFTSVGGRARSGLATLDFVTGVPTAWNPVSDGVVTALLVLGRTLYAGGSFTRIGARVQPHLAAIDLDTATVLNWTPRADRSIWALAASGGSVFAGGNFSGSGVPRGAVAAIDERTGQPRPWNAGANGAVRAMTKLSDSLVIGGDFTQVAFQPRGRIAAINTAAGQLTSWSVFANDSVLALATADNKVFAGGAFTAIGTTPRNRLAAFDVATGNLTAWDPNVPFGDVRAMAAGGNTVYFAGDFFEVGGQSRYHLAAADTTAGQPNAWRGDLSVDLGSIYTVALAGSTVYVGGGFNWLTPQGLFALNSITGAGLPWTPDPIPAPGYPFGQLSALAVWGNYIFIGGWFSGFNDTWQPHLAALDRMDGQVSLPWAPEPNGVVEAVAVSANGVYAGGHFTGMPGRYRPYLAAFPREGAPRFVVQPRPQTVPIGGTMSLVAEASGQAPLTYQWQRNGVELVGATMPTLVISNAQIAHSGEYTLVATNLLGLASSVPATVTILQPVIITNQPAGQTVAPGANVRLSVGATGHPEPLYQWRLNGVNIPGAILPSLNFTNVHPTNSGIYTVVLLNGAGPVESEPAELIVTIPPLSLVDHFGDRVGTNSISGVGRGDNLGATREPGEPFHADKRSGASVWFSWIAPANGIAVFHTRGSSFDTLLAIYTNSVVHQTNVVASDDDRGGFLTSLVSFNARAGTEYQIAIDGFNGATGRVVLSWNLELTTDELPRIVLGPESQTVGPGDDVTFEVVAISTTPQTYQWFFNCLPIAGATNATLDVMNVQMPRVGLYSVQVSNTVRMVESLPAILQINFSGGTVNKARARDKLADLLPLTAASAGAFASVAQGTTGLQIFNSSQAAREPGEPSHCGVIGGASYWFRIHAATNGILTVSTDGSDFDTVLSIYHWDETTLSGLVLLGCDDNGGRDAEDSLVRIEAKPDSVYSISVDGVRGAVGTVRLTYALDQPSRPGTLVRASGGFEMSYEAAAGRNYSIQASTNFNRWTTLMSTSLTASAFWYRDTNVTKYPQRFYRVVPAP